MDIYVCGYNDITIYKKLANKDLYVNLTELEIDDLGSSVPFYEIPNMKSKYCMTVFFGNRKSFATEITVDDLIVLTDIHSESFIRQIRSQSDAERANDRIASMCAEKLLNYNYGKCAVTLDKGDVFTIDFYRDKYTGAGKGRKKKSVCVLSKQLKIVPVIITEINLWGKNEQRNGQRMTIIK